MTAYWLAGATCVRTFGGGLIALRLEAYHGMVLSFCAGALVAGALLNVIPEALDLLEASQSRLPHHHLLFACGLGFLVFYLFEHAVHHHHHDSNSIRGLRQRVGTWGALGIGIHSFFDGVAIGGAFQAGNEMGWLVAVAVMIHKLADGASSVGVMLSTQHSVPRVIAVLSATAIAPLIGTTVQSVFVIPTPLLALILGWFSGVFLYLGATCLLPAAHEASHSRWLPMVTLAGAALIYIAHSLAE